MFHSEDVMLMTSISLSSAAVGPSQFGGSGGSRRFATTSYFPAVEAARDCCRRGRRRRLTAGRRRWLRRGGHARRVSIVTYPSSAVASNLEMRSHSPKKIHWGLWFLPHGALAMATIRWDEERAIGLETKRAASDQPDRWRNHLKRARKEPKVSSPLH